MDDSIKEDIKPKRTLHPVWAIAIATIAVLLALVSLFKVQQTAVLNALLNHQLLQQEAAELATLKQTLGTVQANQTQMLADIHALKSAPKTDVMTPQDPAPYLQLSQIDAEIPTLPLLNTMPPTPKLLEASTAHTWHQGLYHSWALLKSLIIVRHNDQTPALLSATQTTNLLQNLHLSIVQAQLAFLKQDNVIYHHALKQTFDWLHQYFDSSQPQTKLVIDSLQALNKTDINPRPSSNHP